MTKYQDHGRRWLLAAVVAVAVYQIAIGLSC
jgi:hypothetical protein